MFFVVKVQCKYPDAQSLIKQVYIQIKLNEWLHGHLNNCNSYSYRDYLKFLGNKKANFYESEIVKLLCFFGVLTSR